MRLIGLMGAALFASAAPPAFAEAPAAPMVSAGSLIGPALYVSNVERALRFYVEGLGMNVGIEMGPPTRHETVLGFGGDPR
jgi:hypothetical protein